MTPKLITAIAISSVFSFSAFASGSSEPVPTEEAVVDIELEDDAARKRKKNAQRRSAQQQRARNSDLTTAAGIDVTGMRGHIVRQTVDIQWQLTDIDAAMQLAK